MNEVKMVPQIDKLLIISNHQKTDQLIRISISKQSQWNAVHIDSFQNVPNALKELSLANYDSVIIDLPSLDVSPLETLFQIRKVAKEIPLLLINEPGAEKTAIACLKGGADYYLVKHNDWSDEIHTILETILEEREKTRKLKARLLQLEEENTALKQGRIFDETTCFYSTSYFKSLMSRELKRASRHDLDITCLVLDIGTPRTTLKKIKNKPLKPVYEQLSVLLRSLIRTSDIWARLSENRFAAILPHTNSRKAKNAINRINAEMNDASFLLEDTEVPIRLRWGLAGFNKKKMSNENDFLQQAESSLTSWTKTEVTAH